MHLLLAFCSELCCSICSSKPHAPTVSPQHHTAAIILINRLIDWLIDWLINWLADWLMDTETKRVHWKTSHPINNRQNILHKKVGTTKNTSVREGTQALLYLRPCAPHITIPRIVASWYGIARRYCDNKRLGRGPKRKQNRWSWWWVMTHCDGPQTAGNVQNKKKRTIWVKRMWLCLD